jgi:EAL domain-containing protein (putative c-di-GMP-specific phosphodiesterase class I)
MGVVLAIDDFGTGYSSLSYLRRFPIHRVKIDRSFVSEIPGNADDCALTAAIISMAHSLRMEVVAEGVETDEQLVFLRERGCDMLQGYLLGHPMPPAAFALLLEKADA